MGTQKLLLPFRGKPLLVWTLDLVEKLPVERRLLVLGAQTNDILRSLFDYRSSLTPHPLRVMRHGTLWEVLINEHWEEGMGSSLRLAAEHAEGGMLVFLGDMPLVPREAALAVLSRAGGHPVATSFEGRRGFPVYLPAGLRSQLLELKGDIGARDLLREECELVPVDDPGVAQDIDTPEDLALAKLIEVGDEEDKTG